MLLTIDLLTGHIFNRFDQIGDGNRTERFALLASGQLKDELLALDLASLGFGDRPNS